MAVFNANGNSIFTLDDSGGTPRIMTPYVTEIDGLEKLYDIKDATHLSHTAAVPYAGIQMSFTLTVRGKHDITALVGPHVVFPGIVGGNTTRTLVITLEGTSTYTMEVLCTAYRTIIRNKELIEYEAVLVSTGAITIA